MKLLLTGGAGYTGRGIGESLMTQHWVRGFDIQKNDQLNEMVEGDISELSTCMEVIKGIQGVVFGHMAPNPTGYESPDFAIDVNVKGTANMYHAMVEHGIKHAVLISSTGVLVNLNGATAEPGKGPYKLGALYVVTKVFQEQIARHYYEKYNITTSILRPSMILYDKNADVLLDKYGRQWKNYDPKFVDPRDIGFAALNCLSLKNPTLEAFELAQDDAPFDLKPTHSRLNWHPIHTYQTLDWGPRDRKGKKSRIHPKT